MKGEKMSNKYVYPYSLKEAVLRNERGLWRESHRSNCECTRAIEKAISENYDGMYLSDDSAKAIIEKYGYNTNINRSNTNYSMLPDTWDAIQTRYDFN